MLSPSPHARPMKLALDEARKGLGSTSPNPAVGAVVVKDNEVIAAGYHHRAGEPHAEVEAIRLAGERARGATLYVTLEPCCHTGRTPPCTALVREAGIAEVFYGFQDPDPRVSGRGAAGLQSAGIPCELVPDDEISRLYEAYAWWKRTGRPFVTAKLALSLDGKIAGPGGQPIRLTGEELERFTHEQRRDCDAILTTAATVLADDPRLDVRLTAEPGKKPVYVLDRQGRLTSDRRIFSTASEVVAIAGDVSDALDRIGRDGRYGLWVEAGGTLFGELVSRRLVQRAYLYLAPRVLGPEAIGAFSAPLDLLAKSRRLGWRAAGRDVVCEMEL